jgi:hypothetical protein
MAASAEAVQSADPTGTAAGAAACVQLSGMLPGLLPGSVAAAAPLAASTPFCPAHLLCCCCPADYSCLLES